MGDKTGFCIQFTGCQPRCTRKSRIFNSNSTTEDVRNMWTKLYDEEPPSDFEIVNIEKPLCVLRLNDGGDFTVFKVLAEDQYKLQPLNPLSVVLRSLGGYKSSLQNSPNSPYSSQNSHQSRHVMNGYSGKPAHGQGSANNNERRVNKKGRFCVQFCGTQNSCETKHRILYSNSTKGSIKDIWTLVYKMEPPAGINIICAEQIFSLNNDKDFVAFLALAEDIYKRCPLKPAIATLTIPEECKPNRGLLTPFANPFMRTSERTHSFIPQNEQMNGCFSPNSQQSGSNHTSPVRIENGERSRGTSPSHMINIFEKTHPKVIDTKYDENRSDVSRDFIKSNQLHHLSHDMMSSNRLWRRDSDGEPRMFPTVLPYFYEQSERNRFPLLQKPSIASMNATSDLLLKATSPLFKHIQTQQMMHSNPIAFDILQSLIMRNMEQTVNLQMANGFPLGNPNLLSSRDYRSPQPLLSTQEARLNGNKKKRRFNKTASPSMNGVFRDTTKRMRSSPTQSNIHYHYIRAQEYEKKSDEEKKQHNSAHRSHWTHLLYVVRVSPTFLEKHRNDKYDEWSAEARDIYAMCQPNKYKWSFLTLSKQGDLLCKRIKERIAKLKLVEEEARPDWHPSDETLDRAMQLADERLIRLEELKCQREQAEIKQEENEEASNENLPTQINDFHQHSTAQQLPDLSRGALTSISNPFAIHSSLRPDIFSSHLTAKPRVSPLSQKRNERATASEDIA